jgi:kynureninase
MNHLLDEARARDREDELREFRRQFSIPSGADGSPQAYFCGHSLGLQPLGAAVEVERQMQAWRERAVAGHFSGEPSWMDFIDDLRVGLAELTGAQLAEVAVMNTLTVNLHLLMVSFYRPAGKRRRILIEQHAFPSDRYAVESQIRFHGLDPDECMIELGPEPGSRLVDEGRIESFLEENGDEIALVLWPGLQYASGQAFDLQRIAAAARAVGANIGFDLAHAIGNLPLALHDSGCDFAAWCHYKYLNSGPGAVAGCFVHQRHHGKQDLPRFHGWWGNDRDSRFQMAHGFRAEAGAEAWVQSNPPILGLAPLQASLDLFRQAGMQRLRRKSVALTGWLADGIGQHLAHVLQILSPTDPARRGCQLSLRVRAGRDAGHRLFTQLERSGITADWREPDIIRVAPVPLYNRYDDCARLLIETAQWAAGNEGTG